MSSGFFLDHDAIGFTDGGELTLGGRTATSLTTEFGSPLVVILEDVVRANCRRYMSRLALYPRSRVYYASKALLTRGLCRLLAAEGLGIDVVSSGELQTALSAGMDPASITLHGNAKTDAELQQALAAGVGRIVVDNHADMDRLVELTNIRSRAGTIAGQSSGSESVGSQAGKCAGPTRLLLRIAPGIKPDTHKYIQTGQVDSKFGFNLEDAPEAARRLIGQPGLELVGLHCHIGSQIMDDGSFVAAARVMLTLYAQLQRLGAPLDELNIGGGIGIRYQPGDSPPSIEDHLARLTGAVTELSAELGIEPPVLCDEPGRSIIGEAGVTLYTVQSVKRIPCVRSYAGLDGGMTDNPRYALYGARHYPMRANDAPEARGEVGSELWSLSGKCCETGDMLIHDAPLPPLNLGDTVALFSTGAYTYSMASNYNRVPRPAVVLVGSSGAGLLARRETDADVQRLDEVPAWLS